MNHHYPENYHHGGYGRPAPGMHNMGYGGAYPASSNMSQMGHPREGYPSPMGGYGDPRMMNPMMPQQQGGMYGHRGYMSHPGGGQYTMGNYPNYGMGSRMSHPQNSGAMMNPAAYYNNPMQESGHSTSHQNMQSQAPTGYSHQQTGGGHMPSQQQPHMVPQQSHSSIPRHSPMPQSQTPSQQLASPGCQSPQSMQGHPMNQTSPHSVPVCSYGGQGSSPYGSQGSPGMMPPGQVPPLPIRHSGTPQNPQEVADSILQMASAYPSNQTVQVPLKSRPAPYHIPRSPHYNMAHTDLSSHLSPTSHRQQSPIPACQASSSPSPATGVQSPTPSLAPIPNPIPSPGISDVRSPCNQGQSPCDAQLTSGYMSSTYTGHNQNCPPSQKNNDGSFPHGSSPSHPQQTFSPCSMTQAQTYSPYSSPPGCSVSSYSGQSDIGKMMNSDHTGYNTPPCQPGRSGNSSRGQYHQPNLNTDQINNANQPIVQSGQGMGNNPLMSLEKLVMLPETQVVDPKSVVNDACLSSQPNEQDEGPKNGEDPAEGFVQGSDSSVGCQGKSSPQQSDSVSQVVARKSDPVVTSASESHQECDLDSSNTNVSFVNSLELQNNSTPKASAESNASTDVRTENFVCGSPQGTMHKEEMLKSENVVVSEMIPSDAATTYTNIVPHPEKCVEEQATVSATVSKSIVSSEDKRTAILLPESADSQRFKELTGENKLVSDLSQSNSKSKDNCVQNKECENGKIPLTKEDIKCSLARAPTVLSEVPILPNAVTVSEIGDGETVQEDCGKELNVAVQKGFKSLIHSKLAHARRISPLAHTTPCSIAVGANERAACERFNLRRNGFNRAHISSRLAPTRRTRSNSLSNPDSDESLENLSEINLDMSACPQPQDGSRKKVSNATKKNEVKRASGTTKHINTSGRLCDEGTKAGDTVNSTSTINGTTQNSVADVSDEELGYYEGVDNTDFFVNNCSSDESLNCSDHKEQGVPRPETAVDKEKERRNGLKRLANEASPPGKEESHLKNGSSSKSDHNSSTSPNPSKRPRRSCTPKLLVKASSQATSEITGVVSESQTTVSVKAEPLDENCKRTDKQTNKSSPSVLEKSLGDKYPVVVLKKSNLDSPQATVKVKTEESMLKQEVITSDTNTVKDHTLVGQSDSVNVIPAAAATGRSLKSSPKKKAQRRKKAVNKGKGKGKVNKNSEVKDSFKSMKFGRTLDLMKAQKKREASSSGPFIRVCGNKSTPDTVTIFNQTGMDLPSSSGKSLSHSKRSKPGSGLFSTSSVRLVTSLPSEKDALVPSTRTVGDKQWSCAFCGHHSSYKSLGDLFGPYFRDSDLPRVELQAIEEAKKGEIGGNKDKKEPGPSSKKDSSTSGGRRSKGSSRSAPAPLPAPQEVWVHVACAMWSPGVYLVEGKLYGLADAIRDADETLCSVCKRKGAMIGCLHKGCAMKYHVSCAMEKECCMDEENLSILCPKHKDKRLHNAALKTGLS